MKCLAPALIIVAIILSFAIFAFSRDTRFDHNLYGEVLDTYVKNGRVDYRFLKSNPQLLNVYLDKVANLSPDLLTSMPGDEQIAFYINTYNALTLKAIIEYYPVKSIKDISGVWNKLKWKVGQRMLTLNDIEHQILRKIYREPRVHFALVCASKGCPVLDNKLFTGNNLNKQLDLATREFINNQAKVRLDQDNNILYISPIFRWYRKDFNNVKRFISNYLNEDKSAFVKNRRLRIRYLEYDWSLNEQRSSK